MERARDLRVRAGRLLRGALTRCAGEEGQAATEYAITTGMMVLGTGTGLLLFLPAAFAGYEAYINSFYLMIGLPFP